MQYTVMPQGFKNGPSIFQRGMEMILQDLLHISCLVYIDDILVFGETIEEHDKYFRLINEKLSSHGMKVNEQKTQFSKENIEFLYRI